MSRWHRQQSPVFRERLLDWLGRTCAICGATERLEFDHRFGRSYSLQAVDAYARYTRIYVWEADQGLLRILCRRCNARDGGHRAHGEGLTDRQSQLNFDQPLDSPF